MQRLPHGKEREDAPRPPSSRNNLSALTATSTSKSEDDRFPENRKQSKPPTRSLNEQLGTPGKPVNQVKRQRQSRHLLELTPGDIDLDSDHEIREDSEGPVRGSRRSDVRDTPHARGGRDRSKVRGRRGRDRSPSETLDPHSVQSNDPVESGKKPFTSEKDRDAERSRADLEQMLSDIMRRLGAVDDIITENLEANEWKVNVNLAECLERRTELYQRAEANTLARQKAQIRTLSYHAITGMRYDRLLETIESVADTVATSLEAEVHTYRLYKDLSKNEQRLAAAFALGAQNKKLTIFKRGTKEFLTLDIEDGTNANRWSVPDTNTREGHMRAAREEILGRLGRGSQDSEQDQRRLEVRIQGANSAINTLKQYQVMTTKDRQLSSAGEVSTALSSVLLLSSCLC